MVMGRIDSENPTSPSTIDASPAVDGFTSQQRAQLVLGAQLFGAPGAMLRSQHISPS